MNQVLYYSNRKIKFVFSEHWTPCARSWEIVFRFLLTFKWCDRYTGCAWIQRVRLFSFFFICVLIRRRELTVRFWFHWVLIKYTAMIVAAWHGYNRHDSYESYSVMRSEVLAWNIIIITLHTFFAMELHSKTVLCILPLFWVHTTSASTF